MQLYEKITKGKSTRYISHVPGPAAPKRSEFTDQELITLAATVGLTILMECRSLMPAHKFVARKVLAIEESILDLTHGTGAKVPQEEMEYWLDCWNRAMHEAQKGYVATLEQQAAGL